MVDYELDYAEWSDWDWDGDFNDALKTKLPSIFVFLCDLILNFILGAFDVFLVYDFELDIWCLFLPVETFLIDALFFLLSNVLLLLISSTSSPILWSSFLWSAFYSEYSSSVFVLVSYIGFRSDVCETGVVPSAATYIRFIDYSTVCGSKLSYENTGRAFFFGLFKSILTKILF